MQKILLSACLILVCVAVMAQKAGTKKMVSSNNPPKDSMVLISTDYGDIKVKLYNATPQHRDNFIKLVEKGFYDSLLFHRIIKSFMIQGGDPVSKNAAAGVMLGNGDVGYTIPAEFNDSLFHKKGALCAARTDNPEMASSGCQFYIVQGKPVIDEELDQTEGSINNGFRMQTAFQKIVNAPANGSLRDKFMRLQQSQKQDSINILIKDSIMPMINAEMKPFKYTAHQREIYKQIGGVPHLDQGYTVFGEVVEGLDVVDKIAAVQTAPGDRPVQDVRMKMKMVY
jgi:cyclophilin family peptidyl-prolyl cis-trans isomerase